MRNIMGNMKKIVALSSGLIALPIIYQHRSNTVVTTSTETLAVTESLKNYKIENNILQDAMKFILSPLAEVDGERTFLKLPSVKNDTILYDDKIWYVVTTDNDDVELTIVCTSNVSSVPKSLKSYEI